jgi:hypothetical protein
VNARLRPSCSPRRSAATALRAAGLALPHTARALVLVLCGFAHAQDPLARTLHADVVPLLAHRDPTVRGEAALVVAPQADAPARDAILAMASDAAPAARQRALIALGVLGTPGPVQRLGDVLADTAVRGADDGVAAAFGLGLAPPEHGASTCARVLTTIAMGSWKRQRDTLLALLLALSRHAESRQTTALRQLFDDESNRDPEVRALLLRLLLPLDRTLDERVLRRVLEQGSDPERLALLDWLAGAAGGELGPEWLAPLERVATQGERGELRAAALAALTRAGHLPVLQLAVRALRQGTPAECTQALRSMLAIGGSRMLRAAAPDVERERDAARKAAMLAAFDAPLPDFLADHCAKLAADAGQPWPLRGNAALALATSAPDRAAPMLRDLFRGTTDHAALPALARALCTSHDAPVDLARLLDRGAELHAQPERWVALLAIEHPEARRQLTQALHDPAAPPERLATALRVWRAAAVLAAPAARPGALPDALRTLLAVE